jgi:hypothetical protein
MPAAPSNGSAVYMYTSYNCSFVPYQTPPQLSPTRPMWLLRLFGLPRPVFWKLAVS